jgi:hypothetical protein
MIVEGVSEKMVAPGYGMWKLGVGVHLGLLKLHKAGDGRYYVILPPSPVARIIAETGRRASFTAKIVASDCREKEFDGKIVTFARKVTAVRRRDGSHWYRLILPTAYSHIWKSIEDCGAVSLDVVL